METKQSLADELRRINAEYMHQGVAYEDLDILIQAANALEAKDRALRKCEQYALTLPHKCNPFSILNQRDGIRDGLRAGEGS